MSMIIFTHANSDLGISDADLLVEVLEDRSIGVVGINRIKEHNPGVLPVMRALLAVPDGSRVDLVFINFTITPALESVLCAFKDQVRSLTVFGNQSYEPTSRTINTLIRNRVVALHNHSDPRIPFTSQLRAFKDV